MGKRSLLKALQTGPLVFDGAMGTALYERGLLYNRSLDAAVLDRRELVTEVHTAYLEAGAQVIETNSFGANRFRLDPYGLADRLEEINRTSVEIAREVAKDHAWVVGAVGPTGLMLKTLGDETLGKIRDAYEEQAAALLSSGVDALLVETFRQPEEVRLALEGIARAGVGDVPVIATCSFDTFGTMADGTAPKVMAKHLVDWGADVIGVNCADGPAGVYDTATQMLEANVPVIAQPNAGLPRRVDGRFAYMATPEYFLIFSKRLFKAGIRAVGGCCGTTADHVRKIAGAARMFGSRTADLDPAPQADRISTPPSVDLPFSLRPPEDKGKLGSLLGERFVISVEVNPPPGLSLDKSLAGARLLRDGGVDVINVADGPRASVRMGNLALCLRIQNELGMPTILHVTTRDRNTLGLVAHLLACHELDLRNLVIITGDPPRMGDFPDATAVYDVDSIGLLHLARNLNGGVDPGGRTMESPTSFLLATGAEPGATDYPRELERLHRKVEAGAELIMTQPVYDPEVLERFLSDTEGLKVPVLVGLLPLASWRNAEFLHNEVPGMQIPDHIRSRMKETPAGAAARATGVEIAREMLFAVRDRVHGAYIMPPFGRYQLALDVIDGLDRTVSAKVTPSKD